MERKTCGTVTISLEDYQRLNKASSRFDVDALNNICNGLWYYSKRFGVGTGAAGLLWDAFIKLIDGTDSFNFKEEKSKFVGNGDYELLLKDYQHLENLYLILKNMGGYDVDGMYTTRK